MSLTALGKQIGKARCEGLKSALLRAAGEQFKGASMVSIIEPGDLPAASQKSLTSTLCKLL